MFCCQEEVRCRAGKSKMIYISMSISAFTFASMERSFSLTHYSAAALASFLSLEPSNSLPPPTLGTCSLPLLGPFPERLDHSHLLALSSNYPFSEASLAIHPSGLPQLFSIPSSHFSFIILFIVYN